MPTRCAPTVNIGNIDDLAAASLTVTCFTDNSGTTFFGIWELNGGVLELNFYTVDAGGNLTPYAPTSTPIPCDPEVVEDTQTCWIALANGAGYDQDDQIQQIHFWDATAVPPTLIATVWYNQTQRAVILAAPPQADLTACDLVALVLPGCYQAPDGNFFDAVVTLNSDGTVDTMVIDNVVTDPAPGVLVVGRSCLACCVPSGNAETFQHADLPHADIATGAGFNAGTTEYNGNICGDTIQLVPFDLTVVSLEVTTSPEPIFTWEDVANGGAHEVVLSTPGTVRMGFASANAAINETIEFATRKPDRIFPGTGSSIANQAALDAAVLPIVWDNGNSADATYFEWDNVVSVPFIVNSQDGVSMRAFVDSVTFDNTNRWAIDDCCECADNAKNITTGYVEVCQPFDITLPINGSATFSDNASITSTINAEPGVSSLIRSQIERAKIYEQEEINKGLPVTNFIVNTDSGDTFEFPPSALVEGSGTLVFTTAVLVAWPGPLSSTITNVEYSVLDDCGCQSVEMVQQVTDNDDVILLGIYRPEFTDSAGVKQKSVIPLGFGSSGPFAGPCPDEEQVLFVKDLCCNDDLVEGSPDVANQRLVWADGGDPSVMFNGGVIIPGNNGDAVDEVQDKIAPGVSPSIITQVGFDDPTYRTNSFNGLSSLEFDGVDDRMELDLGVRPVNQGFTLFYLVSTNDVANATACLISVGPTGGGEYASIPNTWQISRQGLEDVLVFRGVGAATTGLGNQQPMFTPVTENVVCPLCQGAQNGIDIGLATWTEFADGQLHLITVDYDGNRITGFFDGQLRFEADVLLDGSFPLSEYFRYAGNRINDTFIAMNLAENFISAQQMTPDDVAVVNAYLICRWGIDPSLAAGGAGDLVLGPDGAFNSPSPFREITKASGEVVYLNLNNGLEFPVPPVPGLAICDIDDSCCIATWEECLQYSIGDAGAVGDILVGTWTNVNAQRVRKVLAADSNGVVYTLDFTVDAPNTCAQFNLGDMVVIQFGGTTTVNVAVDISPAYTGPLDWLIRELDGPAVEIFQNFSILNPDNVDAGLNFSPAGTVTADAANTDGDINWNNVVGVSQITFDYVRDDVNNSLWMDFELYDVTLSNVQTTQFKRVFIKDLVSDVTRFQDHDIVTGGTIEIPDGVTIVECPGGDSGGGVATVTNSYARAFNGITALTTIASLLQGGTFTGMSITAISSNNGSVQYTDSSGTVTPMYVGQTKNISAEDLGQLDETDLAIELTDAADTVVIDWTERV